MKKIIFILALFIGVSNLSKGQNSINFTIQDDLCLDQATVKYKSGSNHVFPLGCNGTYVLNIGHELVDVVIVNGVSCSENQTVDVTVNGNVSAKLNVPRYIVKADGIVYDARLKK